MTTYVSHPAIDATMTEDRVHGARRRRRATVNLSAVVVAAACALGTAVAPASSVETTTTIVGWGEDFYGQASPPAELDGRSVTAIDAGGSNTLALTTEGTIVEWGYDPYPDWEVPADLEGQTVTAISAGSGSQFLALTEQGTVVGWGNDTYHQATVPASLDDETVTAISAGGNFSLALTADGKVVAWGAVEAADLAGTGLEGISVTAISAGFNHGLALTADGTVVGWGNNDLGKASVPPALDGQVVTAIAAGASHSLALTADGRVVAWGAEDPWGGGDVGQADVPAELDGETVTAIAAGVWHSLALTADGRVVAWGVEDPYTDDGQATVPTDLDGQRVTAISAGSFYSLALVGTPSSEPDEPVVDRTAPTITIDSPTDGSSHLLGARLTADYACSDEEGGSRIATCTGPVPDGAGVDTSAVGAQTFTVSSTDQAGNEATASSGYRVVYGFSGFAAPIQEGTNLVAAGRKLAFRFSVFDAEGAPVTDLTGVRATAVRFACPTEGATDAIEEEVVGTPGLKSHGDGSYQYNFPTSRSWSGTCRTLGLDLGDDVVRSVDVQFR